MDELSMHPTAKPVQMIADAIKVVSGRNDIVLDHFGGLGSTLIAADKTGRRGFLCELDPVYCDRIIARWEGYAHDDAVSHNGRRTDGGGPRTDPNPSCLGRPTPVWIASNPYRGTKA